MTHPSFDDRLIAAVERLYGCKYQCTALAVAEHGDFGAQWDFVRPDGLVLRGLRHPGYWVRGARYDAVREFITTAETCLEREIKVSVTRNDNPWEAALVEALKALEAKWKEEDNAKKA